MTADRMLAAALANRLIYGDPGAFLATDARALLAMLPRPGFWGRLRRFLPAIRLNVTIPAAGLSGATPGGGTARLDGDVRQYDLDLQGRPCLRAGQWRIYHHPGLLPGRETLSLEQAAGGPEPHAVIRFRHGHPTEMRRMQATLLALGPLSITAAIPRPWKHPT